MKILSSSRVVNGAETTPSERQGFVLVEVIVAMVLLAIATTSLAALMLSVSVSSARASGAAYRNGPLMHEVNRLIAVPYDSLAVGTVLITETATPYKHDRQIIIAEPVKDTLKTVRIIITPRDVRHRPDTSTFTRTKARTTRALNTALQ
ncbi:MAG TPA: prepilin-type N-terminal cleavage/methylation domain-containing protein [Gemmatimonadaceae bacterium]|nr:prepilin-type N-terminal cleavage/methylation domain-containing protein [Gemmatimonadaceae bacterium]